MTSCRGQLGYLPCKTCKRLAPQGMLRPVVVLRGCQFYERDPRAELLGPRTDRKHDPLGEQRQ